MRRSFALALTFVLLGCGDSSGTSGSGGGSTTNTGGSSTANTGGSSTANTGGAGGAGGATTGGCPEGGAPPGTGGGVAACSDIGATDCFSNYDCMAAERCENVGTSDLPTACCVAGARGTGALGEGCLGENDCSSSLCVEGGTCGFTCSDTCMSAADCPADLPQCLTIAFSGTDAKFCVP